MNGAIAEQTLFEDIEDKNNNNGEHSSELSSGLKGKSDSQSEVCSNQDIKSVPEDAVLTTERELLTDATQSRPNTRVLSRSQSVSDLVVDNLDFSWGDEKRRNSTDIQQHPCNGELRPPTSFAAGSPLSVSPMHGALPPPSGWSRKTISHEDTYSQLLYTSAERVLSRLKTRQQDLGVAPVHKPKEKGKRNRNHSICHPQVPRNRKLQPLFPEGSKCVTQAPPEQNGDDYDTSTAPG